MKPATNIKNLANWLLDVWDRLPRDENALNQSAIAGWIQALQVSGGHLSAVSAVNALFFNVNSTIDSVNKLSLAEERKRQLTQWVPAFSSALDDIVNGHRWKHTLSRFSIDRRIHLEYCAAAIDDGFAERATLEDLASLIAEIEALQKKLSEDSALGSEFRQLIHDLFEAVRRACAEYLVRGEQGIKDSMTVILSALIKHGKPINTEEEKRWAAKVWDTATKAATVTTITGVPIYVGAESIVKLLGNS